MSVENLLDQLDEIVENAVSLPLSNGKIFVDGEKIRRILEDIRLNLPKDVRSAAMIVSDRAQIIADARKEAEDIVRQAEERARLMVSKDEITRQAQEKANDLQILIDAMPFGQRKKLLEDEVCRAILHKYGVTE